MKNALNIRVNNYALHLMDVGEAHLIIFVGNLDVRNAVHCLYDPFLLANQLMIAMLLWTNTEVK